MIVTICLLLALMALAPATTVDAQADNEPAEIAMSGVDILDGLTSHDPGLRDRAIQELALMGKDSAKELGREIQLVTTHESETALRDLANADNDNAVYACLPGLEHVEYAVRAASLEGLIQLSPGHTAAVGIKPFTQARKNAVKKLVEDSKFIEKFCEGVQRDEDGELIQPVTQALRFMTLLDRLFKTRALPMLMEQIADVMLGQPLSEDEKETQTERDTQERLRRTSAVWCEALWIADPAIQFNYQPTAPYKERAASVKRIRERLSKMKTREVELGGQKFTGMRYGDYLWGLRAADVTGNRAAAYLRLQWWMGEDVVIAGEGYVKAVDEISNMGRRELVPIRRAILAWWSKYRADTEN